MKCTNCGADILEGSGFCGNCGARYEAPAAQPVEAQPVEAQPVEAQPVEAQPVEAQPVEAVKAEKKKPSAKKIIIIAVAAVLALILIIVGVIVAFNVFGKDKEDNYDKTFMYVDDNSLFVATNDSLKKFDEIYIDNNPGSSQLDYTYVRGNKVIYAQDYADYDELNDGENIKFSIYSKTLGKNSDPVEVASDVTSVFAISDKGDALLYLKGNDLYYNDFKEETRVEKDVSSWCCDNELKTVIYVKEEEKDDGTETALYSKKLGKDDAAIEIVKKGLESVDYISDELDEVIYIADEKLYKFDGSESKEIAKNVSSVVSYNEDEETIYFLESYEKKISINDYIIDEYKASDAKLTEPNKDDYQELVEGYYYSYTTTSDEYYTALAEYQDKLERDEIRALFDEPVNFYKLNSYNGKKVTTITESYNEDFSYLEDGKLVYSARALAAADKVDISEVSSYSSSVADFISFDSEYYYYTGSESIRIDAADEDGGYIFNLYKNELYFLEYSSAKLFKCDVKGKEIGSKTFIEDDIEMFTITDDGDLVTFINDDGDYELHVNDDYLGEISGYIGLSSIEFNDDGSIYFIDYRDEYTGDMISYKNGKTKTLYEDISMYQLVDDVVVTIEYDDDEINMEIFKGKKSIYTADEIARCDYTYGNLMVMDKAYMLMSGLEDSYYSYY